MQHERTAMAWERTAFSLLVAGAAIGRIAVSDGFLIPAIVGGLIVVLAILVLLWSARHYEELHGPLRAGESPVHPTATRLVGFAAIAGSVIGLLIGVEKIVTG